MIWGMKYFMICLHQKIEWNLKLKIESQKTDYQNIKQWVMYLAIFFKQIKSIILQLHLKEHLQMRVLVLNFQGGKQSALSY